MSALQYAGAGGTDPKDLATKRTVDTSIVATSPNQSSVQANVATAVLEKVKKDYVDKQDSRFAPANEFQTKDLNRNIPKSLIGQPNGPVALGGDGKIALSLFPATSASGSGYAMGPYGWQGVYSPSSTGGAVMVATLSTEAIPAGKLFWPLCFGQVMVVSGDTGGRPLAEIRSSGGMLLGVGRGRTMFTGAQGISVLPAADSPGWITSNGGSFSVTMWVSDINGRPLDTKVGSSAAIGGATYILLAS